MIINRIFEKYNGKYIELGDNNKICGNIVVDISKSRIKILYPLDDKFLGDLTKSNLRRLYRKANSNYWQGRKKDVHTINRLSESKFKVILQYNKNGVLINEFESAVTINELYKFDYRKHFSSKINYGIKHHGMLFFDNHYWIFKNSIISDINNINLNDYYHNTSLLIDKPLVVLNSKTNKIIKKFNNGHECCDILNITPQGIRYRTTNNTKFSFNNKLCYLRYS